MDQKLIQRADRMAGSDPNRSRVYEFLRDKARPTIVEAAEQGAVPAAAVSHLLIEAFGQSTMTAPTMRQFCGLACAAIVSEAGFVIDQTGVRVSKDPLFAFGATYRRSGASQGQAAPLLERFVNALNATELRDAETLIRARLRQIQSVRSKTSRKAGEEA